MKDCDNNFVEAQKQLMMLMMELESYATKWTLQKTNDSDKSLLHKDNETLNPPLYSPR
jgi:hypothetical protein